MLIPQLTEILEREKDMLKRESNEYRRIRDPGRLVIRVHGNRLTFGERLGGREKGITGDKPRVQKLGRKKYLEKSIRKRKQAIDILTKTVEIVKKNNIDNRALLDGKKESLPGSEILKHVNMPLAALEWISAADSQNALASENLKYATGSGIAVRSKSERTIADKLTEFGVPFRYEARLETGNSAMYPDFTILLSDGSKVIWEHFGLMDDRRYAENAVRKIMRYHELGFVVGQRLICTFESDIENPKIIENIIKRRLLTRY